MGLTRQQGPPTQAGQATEETMKEMRAIKMELDVLTKTTVQTRTTSLVTVVGPCRRFRGRANSNGKKMPVSIVLTPYCDHQEAGMPKQVAQRILVSTCESGVNTIGVWNLLTRVSQQYPRRATSTKTDQMNIPNGDTGFDEEVFSMKELKQDTRTWYRAVNERGIQNISEIPYMLITELSKTSLRDRWW